MGGKRVREQSWIRHGSHQMTTLVLARKDDLQFFSHAHQLFGARL